MSANVREACLSPRRGTYRRLILHQALVVAAQSSYEHQTVDAFEAMHPFLPLRSLTTDVKHVVPQLPELEQCLGDARGTQPRSEHVLIVGQIVLGKQAVYTVVIATGVSMSEHTTAAVQNSLLDIVV